MSSGLTYAEFVARYPQYGDPPLAQARVELLIADAELEVNACSWGTLQKRAVGLLAAHFCELAVRGDGGSSGATGSIKSEKVGELAVSYNGVSGGGSDLTGYDATVWGVEYIRLRNTLPLTPVLV
jgi:hypothetical protein